MLEYSPQHRGTVIVTTVHDFPTYIMELAHKHDLVRRDGRVPVRTPKGIEGWFNLEELHVALYADPPKEEDRRRSRRKKIAVAIALIVIIIAIMIVLALMGQLPFTLGLLLPILAFYVGPFWRRRR